MAARCYQGHIPPGNRSSVSLRASKGRNLGNAGNRQRKTEKITFHLQPPARATREREDRPGTLNSTGEVLIAGAIHSPLPSSNATLPSGAYLSMGAKLPIQWGATNDMCSYYENEAGVVKRKSSRQDCSVNHSGTSKRFLPRGRRFRISMRFFTPETVGLTSSSIRPSLCSMFSISRNLAGFLQNSFRRIRRPN
ncbi:hypothetical protein SBA5_90035 [Candidatus Sulfotelmatomonas gaucii]|uniref:Uncharacterized protein n=1 Tax=Candidatus Sulfuritelmatomonas gaucii TaxID=2043161 RepID=A0A2N9M8C0_9BACT|nr:hypothetical protein SBA5_90035 [Candidatus Sulfotelmatomonas gaucii]